MSKRIIKVDASSLVKSACLLRFKRIILDGLTEPVQFNDTHYGSCFHLFVKVMYETKGDIGVATHKTIEMFKQPTIIRKKHLTEQHLLKTCFDYWQHFLQADNFSVLEINGKPLVEITFSIPFLDTPDYTVLLEGTIDKIGKFNNGCYAIGDYKTTSQWGLNSDNEIKEYFRRYELSLQLMFYLFCLKLMGQSNPDNELSNMLAKPLGVFIDGVFLSSTKPTKFARSDVRIPSQVDIDNFGISLRSKLTHEMEILKQNEWNYTDKDGLLNGSCSEGNFRCQYFNLCAAPTEMASDFIVKNQYAQRNYEPLLFGKEFAMPTTNP